MIKDIFYFSKPDRAATLVLLVIIIVTTVLKYYISSGKNSFEQDRMADSINGITQTLSPDTILTPQIDTIRRPSNRRNDDRQYRHSFTSSSIKSAVPVSSGSVRTSEPKDAPIKYVRKRRPVAPLDLNVIDSVSLVKLPGIGPWFAMRIIEYRDKLGGYSSVRQLAEIDRLPDSVMQWFVVTDTVPLRKVRVNSNSLSELRRHPYINFYQARAIIELRRQSGPIKSPDRLSLMEEFSSQDLERLKPYLDYD